MRPNTVSCLNAHETRGRSYRIPRGRSRVTPLALIIFLILYAEGDKKKSVV